MANVDGPVVNYSRPRPSMTLASNPPPRPLRSPGRNARTDDEATHSQIRRDTGNRIRARSVPRAIARAPSPSLSVSSLGATMSPVSTVEIRWKQRDSVLSQQSSLYPPSTVTSASAFSGPETPPETEQDPEPEPEPQLPLLDVDDVDYRLKLLVKNSYYLPPVHQKPTARQLSASNSNASIAPISVSKPPTLKSLFRGNKSPKTPTTPHIHTPPGLGTPPSSTKPRNPRPQNRVVVIREKLPSLVQEPSLLPQSYSPEEPVIIPHQIEVFVDPTTAVDGVAALPQPLPVQPVSPEQQQQPGHADWRRDLLQQAVGLSFVTPPVRNHSLPPQESAPPPPLPYGQPISAGIGSREGGSSSGGGGVVPVSREFRSPKVDPQLQIAAFRSPKLDNSAQNTALKPPPRPVRERSRANIDDSPQSTHGEYDPVFHQDPSFRDDTSFRENAFPLGQRAERDMDLMSPEPMLIRPSFSQSPRPSFSSPTPQSPQVQYPYSSSPFGGQPISRPPPRHSSATDHTLSTSAFHYSEHGHDAASRPSMTASSIQSAPRPSMSESHVSHYSTTFGDRSRDSRVHSSISTSRRSSLAYLRGSRSRSLSPSGSRIASTYSPNEVPPVPPLPVHSGSDIEGRSTKTVVYVHPTGALSNTAVHRTGGGSSNGHGSEGTSSYLDPKRGITNCPVPASPNSPRFFGFVPPAFMSPRSKALALPATVDVDILIGETRVDVNGPDGGAASEERARSDEGHGEKQEAVENWRDALVYNEEVRRFDGMVIQHIESEKDRFKRITSRGRGE